MDEKEKELDLSPDTEDVSENLAEQNGIKYETNDNWQFEAEAPTIGDDIFETKGYYVDPDALKVEAESAVQAENNGSSAASADREKLQFIPLAILVAAIIAVLVFLGVRYNTVPNGKEGELINPAGVVATVDETKVSIGMFNYYYTTIVNYYEQNAANNGLDTAQDYASQYKTDADGNQITWLEFLQNEAMDEISQTVALYNKGTKAGLTINDAQKEIIDEYIENAKQYASAESVSLDEYLSDIYGDYCTEETLRLCYEHYFVGLNYQGYSNAKQTVGDDEIDSYFNEHSRDYYQINYYRLIVPYDSADENTRAEAQSRLEDYMSKITDKESMEALVPEIYKDFIDQDINSAMQSNTELTEDEARKQAEGTYIQSLSDTIYGSSTSAYGEEVTDWLFSDETPINAVNYFVNENIGYAYILLKIEDAQLIDYDTYSVRHILIMPKSDDESTQQTQIPEYTDEQWAEAEEKANAVLDEFNSGDKSELSFALLAEANSEDTASTAAGLQGRYGGLYEGIGEGEMQTEFNDWSFDSSRYYGETGMVKTQYGYHIMYFVSQQPIYKAAISAQIKNEKLLAEIEDEELKLHTSVLNKAVETFYADR